MTLPTSLANFDVCAEEWAIRYRNLQEAMESTTMDVDSMAIDAAKTIITRAGRCAVLECAVMQLQDKNEDSTLMEAFLCQTKNQMDHDLARTSQRQLLDGLTAKVTSHAPNFCSNDNLNDAIETDVDAFFDEYPECIRSDWEQNEDDSSSDDYDDDDDHDEKNRQGRSFLHQTQPHVSNFNPPSGANFVQELPPRPMSATGRPNPYQKLPIQSKPPSIPQQPSHTNKDSQDIPRFAYEETESAWNNHTWGVSNDNANPSSHPPRLAPTRPKQTNLASSWEDHMQQQNPFHTAREVMHNMPDDSQYNQTNQSRFNSSTNAQQPQPYYSGQGSNFSSNAYPLQPPHDSGNFQSNGPQQGGPAIPDSLRRKFQPPKRIENAKNGKRPSGFAPSASGGGVQTIRPSKSTAPTSKKPAENTANDDDDELPEELQHLDKELVKKIQHEILESGDTVTFDDIAGLEEAKQTVQEVVCWPMKRPDLFTGLRRAPNGLLLYGPPGTGKTLIGKAIAHESGATFFSISSSSLTSKWIGEGEKLVKTLFAVAAYQQPAVVFIDEIDSLLTQRKSTENEASRRIKTEFLVQLDGTGTTGQGRVLVIGATNKPQELDEAARRRFTKRLYIPLPVESDRYSLIQVMLKSNNHQLTDEDIAKLAKDTDGFSGADLKALCTDAAMGPIRQLGPKALEVDVSAIPPITVKHFKRSLKGTKPSVAPSDLVQYEEWDKVYGSKRSTDDDDDEESDTN